MQSQSQVLFLEDWLRNTTAASQSQPSPPASARAILQAWADLRGPSPTDPDRLLSSLLALARSRSSLHVADSHARLLLSLLSSPSPPLPPSSLPPLLSLLYAWLRKSPRPSPSLLSSVTSAVSSVLSSPPPSLFPHAVLLLGALSAAPALPGPFRRASLDLLCHLLESKDPFPLPDDLVPEVLAGIGYALTPSDNGPYFSRLLAYLLGSWNAGGSPLPTLAHGLLILRLVEWCVLGFITSRSASKIESLRGEISVEKCKTRDYARFALLMAAAGFLRALRLASSSSSDRLGLDPGLRKSIEGSISFVAKYAISSIASDCSLENSSNDIHLLLQCIAVGLARCGPISFDASVLRCLCLALSNEIFPVPSFIRMCLGNLEGNSAIIGSDKVKEHLSSVLFKEAGTATAILCNQYAFADEESRVQVENQMWEYSQELYLNLRMAALAHRGKNNELLVHLEKIAEAAFLMVVVFAAEVSKHKLNSKSSNEFRPEVAIEILVTFSCIEYLRRTRLPEYTDAVRHAVLTIQENAASSASFVESMPSYAELTKPQGSFALEGMRYTWSKDEVQTARMLFYLRVLPTCISLVPASLFGKLVAPIMFLYMQHPNEKVARASHSVFVSFLSSGSDADQDDRLDLKEKLVFYYMQRALEAYPGITPFEGMMSGVAAIVRHLPAGSPAIFYCIHSLVAKATNLCRTAMRQDATIWKTWEGSSEPWKKVSDLLLRLISLVDIQVLPYLLKQLAEFILLQPKDGRDVLLDELYTRVAESDDVTRKPVLVSWLQSLSYLCSRTESTVKDGNSEVGISSSSDGLSLNRITARL
ncbi:uncharacterized protein LOC103697330 [Phoenix dactylifera]|uniref:Uncharacterized protein LOC103697330 n=1 Tax=Phoenix dactylifera TaxID=42345 RepID=A0A8B8ZI90_PHODC|nr:uncharacterized protein LOC103697330 [Phoenix dactylifera]